MVACGKKRKTQNLFFDTDYTDATDFKTVIASWGPRPHYHCLRQKRKTQNLYLDTDYTDYAVCCLRQEIDYAFDFFRGADDTIFNFTGNWK
jgi:hypothetical protein